MSSGNATAQAVSRRPLTA